MRETKSTPLTVKTRAWLPYLIYAVLSVAVLGALLSPGYILTLDMIHSPNMNFMPSFYGLAERVSAAIPFQLLQQLGSKVQPGWLFQKVVLFLILFLAAVGAHRLLRQQGLAPYFTGLLYMINPFTYTRFLAGQWGVLAAYAMTPFAIKAFIELLENANRRNAVKVAVLSTLVGLIQIHGFFLLLLAFFILFLVKAIKERRERAKTFQTSKYVGISAGLFWALNLYWLLPVLTAKDTIMSQLGQADLLLFAPRAISRIMFDVASMYGFWRGGYLYTQDILPFWWLLFIFLLYLAAYGFICKLKDNRHRWIVISFVTVGVVSFLVAVGAATNLTKPLFEWLWVHIPFVQGFRDSHKFVALLCLSYAYLGGLGVNEFANTLRTQRKRLARVALMALVAAAVLTPLGYSFTIFGFYGQLGVTDYPKEWYEVNKHLNEDKDDFNVLFLPWHQYMYYNWLPNRDRVLVNPARAFFDKPVIQGDNIEMPGLYSQSTNPVSKYVEFLLSKGTTIDNLGELLAPLNVKYVILVHEADYEFYSFLYKQEDLSIALEEQGITLFRTENPTARVYSVDSIAYIEDLDEFLNLSQIQDVMDHLYIVGSGTDRDSKVEMKELSFVRKSPVRYQIEGSQRKYTIFTVPQNRSTQHWEYNGKQPLKNLGFMPAFESDRTGGDVVYTRFYHFYLPGYIISATALIVVIALFRLKGKQTKDRG